MHFEEKVKGLDECGCVGSFGRKQHVYFIATSQHPLVCRERGGQVPSDAVVAVEQDLRSDQHGLGLSEVPGLIRGECRLAIEQDEAIECSLGEEIIMIDAEELAVVDSAHGRGRYRERGDILVCCSQPWDEL